MSVFIHVPNDKITKFDPSKKKVIFVGYSDQLKAYRVYIPGHLQIEINIDVIFNEYAYFSKSRKNHIDEDQEEDHEVPRIEETCIIPINHKEWCLGCSSKAKREVRRLFKMDIQDKTLGRWKYW